MSPYRILTVTGLLAGLTLPVLSQAAAASPPPGPNQPPVGVTHPGPSHRPHAAAAVSAQDAAFLGVAHQIDIAEVGAGGIATSKGASASVRELGALFIRDHKAMDAQVTATAHDLGVTMPDTPSRAQLELTKKYLAADGAAFDRLYLRTQLAGHRAALTGITAELAQGSNPDVKKLAEAAAPTVRKHIAALRSASAR